VEFIVKKKILIFLSSALLLSSLIFYVLNRSDTENIFSQSLGFLVEKKSKHHLSIERYLANHQADESAYLAAAQYVSANDLKKKYLSIALQKKTNLPLVYKVTILSYPNISK
jgi:hypothetical protein